MFTESVSFNSPRHGAKTQFYIDRATACFCHHCSSGAHAPVVQSPPTLPQALAAEVAEPEPEAVEVARTRSVQPKQFRVSVFASYHP